MQSKTYTVSLDQVDAFPIWQRFARMPYTLFFDTAMSGTQLGRYSYIAISPLQTLKAKNGQVWHNKQLISTDAFDWLSDEIRNQAKENQPDLPPFQGGWAGYWGYDVAFNLEKLPRPITDDLDLPDLHLAYYDSLFAFDHQESKAWAISSRPETLAWMLDQLDQYIDFPENQFDSSFHWESNFSQNSYIEAVQKVIDYIYAGDIFQANLSQRFSSILPPEFDPATYYFNLRQANAAPFGAYLNFPDYAIASSSPERFISIKQNQVETRPIKGTIARSEDTRIDKQLRLQLLSSEKDRAENTMIVDLMRNDLARTCLAGSVMVPELCALESYTRVHHLVSTVTGTLRPGKTAVDVLRSSLPGGSITGAPKIRAMEIISELESIQRGPYCGVIGWINNEGDMDTSIAIRTLIFKENFACFSAGGGIVADSDPKSEYQETLAKAQAIFESFQLPIIHDPSRR